jgi:hypothetical protein
MFLVPAFSPLSAARRDPFAILLRLPGASAFLESPLPASRPIFRVKRAKSRESSQVSQNEQLQKVSCNSCEMIIYKIIELKNAQNQHLQKKWGGGAVVPDPFVIATDRAMINVS